MQGVERKPSVAASSLAFAQINIDCLLGRDIKGKRYKKAIEALRQARHVTFWKRDHAPALWFAASTLTDPKACASVHQHKTHGLAANADVEGLDVAPAPACPKFQAFMMHESENQAPVTPAQAKPDSRTAAHHCFSSATASATEPLLVEHAEGSQARQLEYTLRISASSVAC